MEWTESDTRADFSKNTVESGKFQALVKRLMIIESKTISGSNLRFRTRSVGCNGT